MLAVSAIPDRAVAIDPEQRRHVGQRKFARQGVIAADQPLKTAVQAVCLLQKRAEAGAGIEPVAARQHQTARAQGARPEQAAAGEDHAHGLALFSRGSRYQPVISERISLIGPASTTMIR